VLDTNWLIHDKLFVDIGASLTTLANATGAAQTLTVGNGGFLYGEGQVNGNVTIDGGAIAAGDGISGFGFLNISGQLHFIDGLLYSVIGSLSTDWDSTRVQAGSILVDGGELMLAWGDAITAQDVVDSVLATPLHRHGLHDDQ